MKLNKHLSKTRPRHSTMGWPHLPLLPTSLNSPNPETTLRDLTIYNTSFFKKITCFFLIVENTSNVSTDQDWEPVQRNKKGKMTKAPLQCNRNGPEICMLPLDHYQICHDVLLDDYYCSQLVWIYGLAIEKRWHRSLQRSQAVHMTVCHVHRHHIAVLLQFS